MLMNPRSLSYRQRKPDWVMIGRATSTTINEARQENPPGLQGRQFRQGLRSRPGRAAGRRSGAVPGEFPLWAARQRAARRHQDRTTNPVGRGGKGLRERGGLEDELRLLG